MCVIVKDQLVIARIIVRRGIALLNSKLSPDWHKRINLVTLNVKCVHNCVLGQLFGIYFNAMSHLRGISMYDYKYYGFCLNPKIENIDYATLTQAWKLELEKNY